MSEGELITDIDALKRVLVSVANSYVGVREVGGANRGEFVRQFQLYVDGKSDGEPWCAAFVQYCIGQTQEYVAAAFNQTITHSRLFKSEHCLTIWNKSDKFLRLNEPEPGCLILWQRYVDDKPTTSGHIGIVTRVLSQEAVMTIEGNTSDSSQVQREGDGVYSLTRFYKHRQGSLRLLGFMKIWD